MYKKVIIDKLTNYMIEEKKHFFKARAYQNVINNINNSDIVINSIDDINQIKGIGKSIREKIIKIIEGNVDFNDNENPVDTFQKIYGVGPITAKKLVNENKMGSLDELKKNQKTFLNIKQQIGLKYFDDLKKKIPRNEMINHDKLIKKTLRNVKHEIVGSYRRGKEESGDIDLIVISEEMNFIENYVKLLIDKGYVIEILAKGSKKFMGICSINNIARRLDIIVCDKKEYPFAILYFTGSKEHNLIMRKKALSLGYTLNEHGLKKKNAEVDDIPDLYTEKEIFEFLKMEYKEPNER
jgi:DNA polymerase/3'-5' exonuclease PolX